jgi:hypothetical protein
MAIQEMNWHVLVVAVYNLIVLAGTTALVVLLDWSPWWYVFSYLFLLDFRGGEDE